MSRLEQLREARASVQADAELRFDARRAERESATRRVAAEGPGAGDSPERQASFNIRAAKRAQLKAIVGEALPFGVERSMGAWDGVLLAPTDQARIAGRPVARLIAPGEPGATREGFATGFLIAPDLLMTNWHVFRDRAEARGCAAQFLYETGEKPDGGLVAELEPDRVFITDRTLDFTIVGLGIPPRLHDRNLGHIRLIEATPKILRGQSVHIIQHPEGGLKQYAVSQNRLVDILDQGFLHYQTDTLEGSSGSPAFNTEWELVALHHASIPQRRDGQVLTTDGRIWTSEMGDDAVHWVANEGIRVSAIIDRLRRVPGETASDQRAIARLLNATGDPVSSTHEALSLPSAKAGAPNLEAAMTSVQMTFTGPVTINLTGASAALAIAPAPSPAFEASIRFDPDYDNREGYDPVFLDPAGKIRVEPPAIVADRMGDILKGEDGAPLVLKYHHFELMMNRKRRLQVWSACNVDYDPKRKVAGERDEWGRDRWIPDPRIPANAQIFNADFYEPAGNIDRGHIVRREDNEWGDTRAEIEFANSDTFHWTNCTPQHEAFNQADPARSNPRDYRGRTGIWGAFENHIQRSRKGADTKACLLAGPILDEADPSADFGRGAIQYPVEFWKVVCVADPDEGGRHELRAFGFILSQADVNAEFGIEKFDPGAFKTYQVGLQEIERRTGLKFDKALLDADAMSGREPVSELKSVTDVHGV
jgi:endonuclease G, mitochondrial